MRGAGKFADGLPRTYVRRKPPLAQVSAPAAPAVIAASKGAPKQEKREVAKEASSLQMQLDSISSDLQSFTRFGAPSTLGLEAPSPPPPPPS